MPKNRGNRPQASRISYEAPLPPVNHNEETPEFCLHFLRETSTCTYPAGSRLARDIILATT
jgi:hypothetical protein